MEKLIIAIDGPAASGKSTTAKLVAQRLNYLHIDTGAMYRAIALKVLEHEIDLGDEETIGKLAEDTHIQLQNERDRVKVVLDGQDVSERIRERKVTHAASAISKISKVRQIMVREQRSAAQEGGVVLEGRDIGTVVFPNADVKIFMVANVEERVKRRRDELLLQNIEVDVRTLEDEIVARDANDSQRTISPLRKADDAFVLDTSGLTIDQQVDFIIEIVHKRISKQN